MNFLKLSAGILFFVFIAVGLPGSSLSVASAASPDDAGAGDTQSVKAPDIKWFKQEMKIAPKYTEQREGILGMSWVHFITMTFLVIFFFGALITYHRRTTRTTRILEQLLKEE